MILHFHAKSKANNWPAVQNHSPPRKSLMDLRAKRFEPLWAIYRTEDYVAMTRYGGNIFYPRALGQTAR
jgi:hypothetical protein